MDYKQELQVKFDASLKELKQLSLEYSGGAAATRAFMLSLYDGSKYPLDMRKLRKLDTHNAKHVNNIMNILCRPNPRYEMSHYIEDKEYWAMVIELGVEE